MEVLNRETEQVTRIAALQMLVRKAVRDRQWTDFESLMQDLGTIGAEFEILDRERLQVFSQFAGGIGRETDNRDFYALAAHFPETERRDLTEVYRRLKLETLRIRLENNSLLNYIRESQALASGFLNTVFPETKGKLYSRQGRATQPELRSMVLNQEL
jgi:hypothetical protein